MPKHLRDIVARLPDTTPKNYDSLYGKRKVEKVTLGQDDDYYIGSDDKGAKKFVAKHEVEVHDYPVQNDGDVPFKAVNIKPVLASDVDKQHGYQGYPAGEDRKVYEEVEQMSLSAYLEDKGKSKKKRINKSNIYYDKSDAVSTASPTVNTTEPYQGILRV